MYISRMLMTLLYYSNSAAAAADFSYILFHMKTLFDLIFDMTLKAILSFCPDIPTNVFTNIHTPI